MRIRYCVLFTLFALIPVVGCITQVGAPPVPPTAKATLSLPAKPIELTEITVAGLDAAIKENKGKVVIIDVWFLGCGPCKKKFPSFVELHKKYADQGLVCMSLDIFMEELEIKADVLDYLTKQGATFANFIFKDADNTVKAWLERHKAEWTPAIVLYDRKGEWVQTPEDVEPEQLEQIVQATLAKK